MASLYTTLKSQFLRASYIYMFSTLLQTSAANIRADNISCDRLYCRLHVKFRRTLHMCTVDKLSWKKSHRTSVPWLSETNLKIYLFCFCFVHILLSVRSERPFAKFWSYHTYFVLSFLKVCMLWIVNASPNVHREHERAK